MAGGYGKKDAIKEAIQLADKFLKGLELEEIKVVAMTRLGQMLMEKLLEENRMDDLKQAAKDKEYREKLLKELKTI